MDPTHDGSSWGIPSVPTYLATEPSDEDYVYGTPPMGHTPPAIDSWSEYGAPDARYSSNRVSQPQYTMWQQPEQPSRSRTSLGIRPVAGPSHQSPRPRQGPTSSYRGASPGREIEADSLGRYYCTVPDCEARPEDKVFTRKSDWKRHNDKHTRPYRCDDPACADLPGFGWIGGLNRHREELHNAAAQHKCPYPDCKRHIQGFNRSANLKNHIRKVHTLEGGSQSDAAEDTDSGPSTRRTGGSTSQEALYREIQNAKKVLEMREREEEEARRRTAAARQHLTDLRADYEDIRHGYY